MRRGWGRRGRAVALAGLLAAGAAQVAPAEDRALVIGIDDYAAIGARLEGAAADARRMRDHLVADWGLGPGQVTLLLDGAATSDSILDAVTAELTGGTEPGDLAVLYFAGMGSVVAGGPRREPVRALLAHDADSPLGAIQEDLLADLLDLIPDRRVVVVIDASFEGAGPPAGELRRRSAPTEAEPGRWSWPFGQGQAVRAVWNAAGQGQAAWEEAGQGVFTRAFLAAGPGPDAPGEALLAGIAAELAAWCQAARPCDATGTGLAPSFAAGPRTPEAEPPPATEPLPALEELVTARGEGLALSLEGPEPLRVGDRATLRLGGLAPGRLILVGRHGDAPPEVLAPDLPVAAPAPSGLALGFRAAEPPGQGRLVAVLLEGWSPERDGPLLPDPDLAGAGPFLDALRDLLAARDPALWSGGLLAYDIGP